MARATYQVFNYIDELNCFVVNPEYEAIVRQLGLVEWNEVVWIGRYFCLDNDVGEHWFDNWEAREESREQAARMGLDESELLIIDPWRMQDGRDGPCHPDALRSLFWRDVLLSLRLSLEMLIAQARFNKQKLEEINYLDAEEYVPDLEARIELILKQ